MITVSSASICSRSEDAGPVLTGIDCTFEKGTMTLLIGKTGSGKTTFLHALAGLVPLREGSIRYGNEPLWNGRRVNDALKLSTGIVFQYPEYQLFAQNILKEFNYSLRPYRLSREEKTRRIRHALSQMELPEDILKESFLTLSDGTKRKVALATTIATEPEWLLLDEPTAGIDPAGTLAVVHAIRSYIETTGGGTIIATHDLDTFLPLADRVLVLNNGTMEADVSPKELSENPGILLRANIGLPTCIRISTALQRHGISLPNCHFIPEEVANAIIQEIRTPASRNMEQKEHKKLPARNLEGIHSADANMSERGSHPEKSRSSGSSVIHQLDPRAKWLFYMLFSTGILLQDHWIGLWFAAAITCMCTLLSKLSIRAVLKPAKPFIMFILLSALVSGLQFTSGSMQPAEVHFSLSAALRTVQQLSKIFLVMVTGILFMFTTSQQLMKQGLEQTLSFLNRFKIPVEAVTFSTALMLRFIPILLQEVKRYSDIVKSRGKAHTRAGSIRLRDVHVFMIPLILSMLKHAEDLAFALEIRGYRGRRMSTSTLQFNRRDKMVMAFGVLLLCTFIAIDASLA
jgi:energy-coupling factor transport system ATP-binding protein